LSDIIHYIIDVTYQITKPLPSRRALNSIFFFQVSGFKVLKLLEKIYFNKGNSCSLLGCRLPGCGIWGMEGNGTWSTGYGIWDMGYGI
jgi:hypothetical protein